MGIPMGDLGQRYALVYIAQGFVGDATAEGEPYTLRLWTS